MDTSHIIEGLRPLAVAIGELKPDPENARKHGRKNLDAIKESLRRYGQVKPIAARRADGVVLAGNGRLRAAQDLGWPSIAVVWMQGTEAELRAFAILDNKTSDLAEWDEMALADTLASLHAADIDLASMGFTGSEIEALDLGEAADPVGVAAPPEEQHDAPTPEPAPRAKDPAPAGGKAEAAPRARPKPRAEAAAVPEDAPPAVAGLGLSDDDVAVLREAADACRAWRGEPGLTDAAALVIIAHRFTRARRREKE